MQFFFKSFTVQVITDLILDFNLTTKTDMLFPVTLVIFVHLLSLPVAHLSDVPRRWLVVTGDSARIQDETAQNSAWFFNVPGVQHRHTGPRFNVSSERLLIIWLGSR